MTENQEKVVFDLLTKTVNGIQALQTDVSVLKDDVSVLKEDVSVLKEDVSVLKEDVSVLKQDVAELKVGQFRIEKAVHQNTRAINEIAGEQFRLKVRLDQVENAGA